MDSHGEAERSKSRHRGLKGSKPRCRLRKMDWEGGTGRKYRRTLRGLRSSLQEQFAEGLAGPVQKSVGWEMYWADM